jgi:hypothetical protein
MAKPASRVQLGEYCLRRLGYPVIDINVDDDQVEDRIDDALQKLQEFHFDGVEKIYMKHQITALDMTNQYIPIPDAVIGVVRMFPVNLGANQGSSSSNGVDFNIFNLNYQIRLNDLNNFTSTSLVYYSIAQSHLALMQQMLNGESTIRFNKHQNRLYIDLEWGNDISEGTYLVIECYRIVDTDTFSDVYNDSFLKDYTTALIKRQWGENMKKYNNYTLPGGMQINSQQIYDEAVAEIQKLEERLRDRYEMPMEFMIG